MLRMGPFGDRIVSKLKSIKDSHKAPAKISNAALSRFLRKTHVILGALALLYLISTPSMRDAVMQKSLVSTLAYFVFEIAHWYICKWCVGQTKLLPVNYLSLVLIRCFLFFHTKHRLTVYSFFPELSPSSSSSWVASDVMAMTVIFFVVIPATVSLTKIYIGDYHVLCLLGTSSSSALAVLVLLPSNAIANTTTPTTKNETDSAGAAGNYPNHNFHFRLCLLWILVTFIMTFVTVLSIAQRLLKRARKEIPLSQVGHSLLELYVMILAFGLAFPYVRLVYPDLRLDNLFPTFQGNGEYVEGFVWLSFTLYSTLTGNLETASELMCHFWNRIVAPLEMKLHSRDNSSGFCANRNATNATQPELAI